MSQGSQSLGTIRDGLAHDSDGGPGCGGRIARASDAAPLDRRPPTISYVGGQLRIDALGSTLADVLTKVAALTGVKIDVPAGADSERMPVVELGPGPARQILASLLSDSNFDYLIQASDADPEKIQSVLLMPREKKGERDQWTDAAARASRGPRGGATRNHRRPTVPLRHSRRSRRRRRAL